MYAEKVSNSHLTTLRILEEKYLGSLTCHVIKDPDVPLFEHFHANASTVFRSANVYEPFSFGKPTHRFITCDIYLKDADFPEKEVDLEIALLLQPLLEDGRSK